MRGHDFLNHSISTSINLAGEKFSFVFCFETLATAEYIYQTVYNEDFSITRIINDLAKQFSSALYALAYGAVKVKHELMFKDFLAMIKSEEDRQILLAVVVSGLNQMFSPQHTQADSEESQAIFQWDIYYKAALNLGLSHKDFWASTPKMLWLLIRDKEQEGRQEWLSKTYV